MPEMRLDSHTVIECFSPHLTGKLLKRFAIKSALKEFAGAPGYLLCSSMVSSVGDREIGAVGSVEDALSLLDKDARFVRCPFDPFPVSLLFAELKDKDGVDIEFVLDATIRIRDLCKFLIWAGIRYGRTIFSASMSINEVEMFLVERWRSFVIDRVGSETYEYLKVRNGLPATWWKERLANLVDDSGLQIEVVGKVRWESEMISLKEEARKKQALLDIRAEQENEALELEIRRKEAKARYEIEKNEIETDLRLNEVEQVKKLEEQERRGSLEQLEFELEKEKYHWKIGKIRAQKEAEIAYLRKDTLSAENITKNAEEAGERHSELIQAIEKAKEELAGLSQLVGPAMKDLNQPDGSTLNRLLVKASNVSPQTLEMIGAALTPQHLAQVFRDKYARDNLVKMKKVDLHTRDIALKKVDVLTINSPLRFEFIAGRSGYAAIFDIGASGRIWIHSPNVHIGPEHARVEKNKVYQIPGCHLLDTDDLVRNGLQYIVGPPPGWEEMVVVISDVPIIEAGQIVESAPHSPFVVLDRAELEKIMERLAEMSPESWSSGVLSFLVE